MLDPRLALLDLRTYSRLCALGAAYGPGGALLRVTPAAREWGLSPARLRATLARLVAWGYLRRVRAGRFWRFFANDFPPLLSDCDDIGPMLPLRPAWQSPAVERAVRKPR